MDENQLSKAIANFPRVQLGFFPTPLHECPRLTQFLKGPRILMKRDDCSGLAFGGNKTRHLEFSMADALAQKADVVVAGATLQSNYCRQTAAAAARLGLRSYLVLTKDGQPDTVQGNYLLDRILGAEIEIVDLPIGGPLVERMKEAASKLRRRGFSPYILLEPPRCDDLGALSYAEALIEIRQQLEGYKIEADYIYCSAAGPTQAGLMVAAKALNLPLQVCGITPLRGDYDVKIDVADNANRLFKLLDIQLQLSPQDVLNWDDYVGERYGKPSPEGLEAIRVVARTEGILLDPVYTAKAMAGLFDHVRRGMVAAHSTVVFIHTGGTPALFAYASELDID